MHFAATSAYTDVCAHRSQCAALSLGKARCTASYTHITSCWRRGRPWPCNGLQPCNGLRLPVRPPAPAAVGGCHNRTQPVQRHRLRSTLFFTPRRRCDQVQGSPQHCPQHMGEDQSLRLCLTLRRVCTASTGLRLCLVRRDVSVLCTILFIVEIKAC